MTAINLDICNKVTHLCSSVSSVAMLQTAERSEAVYSSVAKFTVERSETVRLSVAITSAERSEAVYIINSFQSMTALQYFCKPKCSL